MKPATLLETWKTLLTVLLEHDKFNNKKSEDQLMKMKRLVYIYVHVKYVSKPFFAVVVVVVVFSSIFDQSSSSSVEDRAAHTEQ